jgi:N-acetylglucosamine-6-phosphate deacetylase
MKQTITARRLITDIGEIEYPVLTIEDGLLGGIESDPDALARETDTLTAAFFDVHTHGAVGVDVMKATRGQFAKVQSFFAQHGVAHYLPTTVTAPIDATLRALESLADAVEAQPYERQAKPVGIHLEGPFLSHAKRGVHPTAELQRPSIDLLDRFQVAARGHIRLLTFAPELPGAVEFIEYATAQGIKVSLGHSDAKAADTIAAIAAGAASATHTFNGMRALDHREPGIVGTVLDNERLFAELICDGIHVSPAMVRLWWKTKAERAILVTDSMSAAGMVDGEYALGGLTVQVEHGIAWLIEGERRSLAGSLLTLDGAVENLQSFTGASLAEATGAASHAPASMMNTRQLDAKQLTRLAPGSPANLNRFNAAGKLIDTFIRGLSVHV